MEQTLGFQHHYGYKSFSSLSVFHPECVKDFSERFESEKGQTARWYYLYNWCGPEEALNNRKMATISPSCINDPK